MIPTKKNISILHPFLNKKGGAVAMMIYLGNFFQKKGNTVTLYTTSYDKNLFSNDIDFPVVISSKIKIAYMVRKSDYVFIGNSPMQFVGVISKALFFSKAKLFWWHHHYPWYYDGNTNFYIFLKRYFEKLSIKFIDVLIANSLFIENSLKEIYGRNSKILYPIIDNDFLHYKNRNKNFDSNTIITYSRWVKGKNLKQIFQTYEHLKNEIPKLKLIVGGIGEELCYFKNKYSSDTHIKFLGLLDKKSIIDNLDKSNVFLFPSLVDSFGISALEAMSIGVPVVGFSGKGLSEIVQNDKNGCTVESEKDFTKKTRIILQDRNLQKKLSEQSRKDALKFSHYNFEKQLTDIFL